MTNHRTVNIRTSVPKIQRCLIVVHFLYLRVWNTLAKGVNSDWNCVRKSVSDSQLKKVNYSQTSLDFRHRCSDVVTYTICPIDVEVGPADQSLGVFLWQNVSIIGHKASFQLNWPGCPSKWSAYDIHGTIILLLKKKKKRSQSTNWLFHHCNV